MAKASKGCLRLAGALKAYTKSLDLHKQLAQENRPQENGHVPEEPVGSVPARLLNNAAVVHMACGKQREALDLLLQATKVSTLCTCEMFGLELCIA